MGFRNTIKSQKDILQIEQQENKIPNQITKSLTLNSSLLTTNPLSTHSNRKKNKVNDGTSTSKIQIQQLEKIILLEMFLIYVIMLIRH